MFKTGIKNRKITPMLMSLVIVFLFLTTTILFGCKTVTTAETTVEATSAGTTAAAETTGAATKTTEAAETTAAEITTANTTTETTAAETTAAETTAAATTETAVKFTNEKLILSGSTTLLEVAQAWAEAFMNKFGGEVTVNGGGSGVGISDLLNGTNDIANSSRQIKSDELTKAKAAGKDVKEYKVLIDGICVVTSKNINVPELTLNQLADIYIGNITNWKDVGGPDAQILLLARDSNSGTGEFFLQKVVQLGQTNTNDYSPNALRLQSNADVTAQVEGNNNAIGYIGMGYLKDAGNKVNLVKLNLQKILLQLHQLFRQ